VFFLARGGVDCTRACTRLQSSGGSGGFIGDALLEFALESFTGDDSSITGDIVISLPAPALCLCLRLVRRPCFSFFGPEAG
jgi:hypothetical protein